MQNWRDDGDREKQKYSDGKLSHCHFLLHKSHMELLALEPEPPE
jgi:hypothetical protein